MSLNNLGLDAFEVIAEVGTIVLAAERLNVTQTALTQRIKALEGQLETPLFTRSRKGMSLTHEGKLLYKYCLERRFLEQETIKKVKGLSFSDSQRIRISGPTLQTETRILSQISLLKKKFPELYFTFDIDDSTDLFNKLKEGETDLILTSSTPYPSLKFKALSSSEMILVGPANWKKRNLKEVLESESIIDFNSQDPYTVDFLKRHKLLPRFLPERHYINNTHQMLHMVEQGLGYAVFDIRHVEDKIRARKLVNLAPNIKQKSNWYLCWNDHGERAGQALRGVIAGIN